MITTPTVSGRPGQAPGGCAFGEERRMTKKEPRPAVVFPLVGRGFGVVELRGFEPLTFSLRRLLLALCRCLVPSGGVHSMGFMSSTQVRGCAATGGQERATDRIARPLARRCPGSRVAGGHRIATRSAIDAGRRRAHRRRSGRRLGGDRRGGP